MAETSASAKRIEWIDWMKALGIYLIVLGHFYSVGETFIYVFHVPVFFVISGFLNKRETDTAVFWRKLWYNLAVPMLLMAVINFGYSCILKLVNGSLLPADAWWFVRNLAFGMVSGLDTLWFVYTLILLKIIYQFCRSERLFYLLVAVMLALAFVYRHHASPVSLFFLNEPNAFADVFTAYPFFAAGVLLRKYKQALHAWDNKAMLMAAVAVGLLLVVLCSRYNGYVGLYRCHYGDSMLLCLVGGFAGTVMIWALSKLAGHATKAVAVLSRGTIIILGFHKILIDGVWAFCSASALDIVFAFVILLLFIPLIIAIEDYFPLLAGKYRIQSRRA